VSFGGGLHPEFRLRSIALKLRVISVGLG